MSDAEETTRRSRSCAIPKLLERILADFDALRHGRRAHQ